MGIRLVFKATVTEVYQSRNPETGVLGAEFVTVFTRGGDSLKFRSEERSFKELLSPADALDPREFLFDVVMSIKTEGYGKESRVSFNLLAVNDLKEVGQQEQKAAAPAQRPQPQPTS